LAVWQFGSLAVWSEACFLIFAFGHHTAHHVSAEDIQNHVDGETKCVKLTQEESLNVTAPGLQNCQLFAKSLSIQPWPRWNRDCSQEESWWKAEGNK
jgi:hypothetical protein